MAAKDRHLLLVIVSATALAVGPAAASAETASAQLEAIVETYWEEALELNPLLATFVGDHRFNDRLAIDIGPDHRRGALELEELALARAQALSEESLDSDDLLTLEVFVQGREQAIEAHRFPSHLLPVDQLQSLPVLLPMLGAGGTVQPFETVEDYENWLVRLTVWPPWVDRAIANMRQGLARRIVHPRPVVERIIPLLETQLVDDPRQSTFFGPIRRMPASFGDDDRKRLERAYLAAIEGQVIPGYRRLLHFTRDTYLPRSRPTIGLSDLPGGQEWYLFLVHKHGSTDLTPEEIHKIGRREVTRISSRIGRLQRRLLNVPRTDSRGPSGHLLDGYRALRERVEPRLPDLFSTLPAAGFEIRSVEPFRRASAAGASYLAGLSDGSRPGRFYVNADEETRAEPSEALFLHEAIPGHHFQISLQREQRRLPRFRRFGTVTAFVEGWALYAESLGQELGLYRSREQELRALGSELFRARRLVVDTGIHHLGWSRKQAIEYLGSSREVDRYITWPGQALAYKLGELRISELRKMAEKRLGRRFDKREFHDVVLSEGSLPLGILERRVRAWIATSEPSSNPGLANQP